MNESPAASAAPALITTTDRLGGLCERLAAEPFVAVDTEFMRDRTFWPKLCLVQLAGEGEAAAVDPLAPGIDLAPLFALMADPGVVKVFHAARQDLEIFWYLTGRVPAPLFDTQLAAMVCGYGEEVGYETLVAKIAKARLDKTSRFTDWAQRPLSAQQLRYALADVIHLRTIYLRLKEQLERTGRAAWVGQELAELSAPETYEQPPELAWKRVKVRSRDPRFLAIVRELAAWREREAQRRDVPRNRILRDDLLLEVAASRPTTADELGRLRRVHLDPRAARGAVEAIAAAMALPPEALPQVEPVTRQPSRGTGALIDLLRVLLKLKSDAHGVAPRLIANTDDLEAIAAEPEADVRALKGWRRQVFGDDALALKRGELGLAVRGRRVVVLPLATTAPVIAGDNDGDGVEDAEQAGER